MKAFAIVYACCLALGACGTSQHFSLAKYPPGDGSFGIAGLVVDDGLGSGGMNANQTPAVMLYEILRSGHFASVVLNRIDLPQQIYVKLGWKPHGSEGESTAKLFAGAATLFLIPIPQTVDYSAKFKVECRGRLTGEWTYIQTVDRTQFLLVDPNSDMPGLVESFVSRFIHDAVDSEKLRKGCN